MRVVEHSLLQPFQAMNIYVHRNMTPLLHNEINYEVWFPVEDRTVVPVFDAVMRTLAASLDELL